MQGTYQTDFVILDPGQRSRRGVGDKPMSFKPVVEGSIPGFSIKPLSVEPSGVPVIKHTIIINPPGPVLVTATKRFFLAICIIFSDHEHFCERV